MQRGARDSAAALAATIDAGESLFIFPEGTFVRAPGVMPFRLGAFQAAVDKGVPVVPVALRGTRAVWPDETLAAAPGADVRLRRRAARAAPTGLGGDGRRCAMPARAWIARESGEPAVSRGAILIDQPADD